MIRSIVDKINAGNWGNWEISVLHGAVDFRTLSDKEKQYISKAFARHGPASKAGCRMDSDVSFIVRLKLSDPETLKDLSEAFRVGYFDASDAAAVCRRVADVRLLPIAAKFLFTDKAPKKVEMSDVLVEVSPSIHSASAISGLLAVCPEFPEAVRKAVKTWDHYDISQQDFLSIYRKWWSENRQRIEKGKYGEVTAPASRQ